MKRSVVVVAADVVTGLGNLDETWSGLLAGQTSLAPQKIGETLDRYPVGMVPELAGGFGSPERTVSLLDRLFAHRCDIPEDSSLLVATTKGAVDALLEDDQGPWREQPWNIATTVSQMLSLSGPTSTVSAACASGTLGVISGAQQIVRGETTTSLVVGIDILSRFVVSGFAKLQALSAIGCKPFDRDRDGLSLGEGAGYVLLASVDEARKRNWPVLAQITGWGATCDAVHITAPCRAASGLLALFDQLLGDDHSLGAINAHGTGTRFNDAMEMHGFTHFWKTPPPCHSVKGAIGHSLGAAGVIEAAVAVRSLQEGMIPPTVGLQTKEDPVIPVSGTEAQSLKKPSILSINSGFGGINGAILLELV